MGMITDEYEITSDGTIYRIEKDGELAKIARILPDNEIELLGDTRVVCDHAIKRIVLPALTRPFKTFGSAVAKRCRTFVSAGKNFGLSCVRTCQEWWASVKTWAGKFKGAKVREHNPAVKNEVGIILGYLKVFPRDLGPFPNNPEDIIKDINAAQQFGYDSWRIPTENELALLVSEGYIRNAGNYMSNANGKGKLRLVTDKRPQKEL